MYKALSKCSFLSPSSPHFQGGEMGWRVSSRAALRIMRSTEAVGIRLSGQGSMPNILLIYIYIYKRINADLHLPLTPTCFKHQKTLSASSCKPLSSTDAAQTFHLSIFSQLWYYLCALSHADERYLADLCSHNCLPASCVTFGHWFLFQLHKDLNALISMLK